MGMRNHEFRCDKGHEEVVVVLRAPFGEAPEVPRCATCDEPMAKVFGEPLISYATHWHYAQRNLD